jgi:hypothetical protein
MLKYEDKYFLKNLAAPVPLQPKPIKSTFKIHLLCAKVVSGKAACKPISLAFTTAPVDLINVLWFVVYVLEMSFI